MVPFDQLAPFLLMYTLTKDSEIASQDPVRHKELLEYSRDILTKREPALYKNYKEVYCLECSNVREIPISRYCNKHYRLYNEAQRKDSRTGRRKHPNYAYSEEGFNEGMNAWVHDKWHYEKLRKRFSQSEQLEQI